MTRPTKAHSERERSITALSAARHQLCHHDSAFAPSSTVSATRRSSYTLNTLRCLPLAAQHRSIPTPANSVYAPALLSYMHTYFHRYSRPRAADIGYPGAIAPVPIWQRVYHGFMRYVPAWPFLPDPLVTAPPRRSACPRRRVPEELLAVAPEDIL